MSATFKQSGDKGIIMLEGELTLPHAEEMKKAFLKALLDADDVAVRFKNIKDVDLSCLQLLCSVHRSAVRLKKQVRFDGSPPQVFKAAAKAAGYARLKGCKLDLDCEGSCLWKETTGYSHG